MVIDKAFLDYLNGKKFDNNLLFPVGDFKDHPPVGVDRIAMIERLVEGKQVIHLGCCDHVNLINQKRQRGQWLHDRIMAKAQRCAGIDINCEGIEYLRDTLGIPDVYCCDITRGFPEPLSTGPWDALVAAEIIEHVPDPAGFLRNLRHHAGGRIKEIIITVPNAFRYTNFRKCSLDIEKNNSDHRYWFTPYTICKICSDAGLTVKDFFLINFDHVGFRFSLRYFKLRRHPLFRSTIVVRASLLCPTEPV